MGQRKRLPMETYEHRVARFSNNPPDEIILSILDSFRNFFIPQLSIASEKGLYELLILGIHSGIETISEHIFLKPGVPGFRFYLENFVDVDSAGEGFHFSEIASDLNELRNNIAHQWLSAQGHMVGYDDEQKQGYRYEDGILWVNPIVYFQQFKSAFGDQGVTRYRLLEYKMLLDEASLEHVKTRFLKQFKGRP